MITARSTGDPDFGEQLKAARRGKDWAWDRLYTKLIGPITGYLLSRGMDRLGNNNVQALLDQLTDDQREVLALRVVADLSLKETARVTGRDVGAVKALQRRAIQRLQRNLEIGTVTQ